MGCDGWTKRAILQPARPILLARTERPRRRRQEAGLVYQRSYLFDMLNG
jgi:hypothetical protein